MSLEDLESFIGVEKTMIIMGREQRYSDDLSKWNITPKEGVYFKGFRAGFLRESRVNPYKQIKTNPRRFSMTISSVALFVKGFHDTWEKGYDDGREYYWICRRVSDESR